MAREESGNLHYRVGVIGDVKMLKGADRGDPETCTTRRTVTSLLDLRH